jgi:hypothetical protein
VPLGRWCSIRGRGPLQPLHLTTYLLVRAYQQLWLDEHHGPFAALQLVFTSCPAFLAPDRPVLLAVVVSAHARTTAPCGERLRCPTGFRHRCLPW